MVKKKMFTPKILKRSVGILYLLVIVPLLIAVLNQFGLIDLSRFEASTLTILGSLFVASEIGVLGMIKKMKLGDDPWRIIGLVVVLLAMLGAFLSLMNISWPQLEGIQGAINLGLIFYIVVEAFR